MIGSRLAILLLLLVLAGCGSAAMERSVPAANYTGSPTRILLVSQFRAGGASTVDHFHAMLREKFSQCNVALVGVVPDAGPASDIRERVSQAAADQKADSVLELKIELIPGINGKPDQQRYALNLRDLALRSVVWRGEGVLELTNLLTYNRVNEDFARQIVQTLVNANVIKTCPKGPPGTRN